MIDLRELIEAEEKDTNNLIIEEKEVAEQTNSQ